MRIRTNLILTSTIAIVALTLVMVILLLSSAKLRDEFQTKERLDRMARTLATLYALLNDHKDFPTERTSQQLEISIMDLERLTGELRTGATPEDIPFVARMEVDGAGIAALVGQTSKIRAPMDSTQDEFMDIVIGEVYVELDQVVTSIQTIRKAGRARLDSAWRTTEFSIAVIMLAGVAFIGVYTLLVGRTVLKPVKVFSKAAEAIGRGDYSARSAIGGTTEISDLSRIFDGMAEELGRTISELHAEVERRTKSEEALTTALEKIKTLRGLLPICASCKKIRDDKGYWSQVEQDIGERTDAVFSHSICPQCAERLYPGLCDGITEISNPRNPSSDIKPR